MNDALLARLPRVVRLEPDVFVETGRDESATGPALAVVLAAALLEGAGRGGGLEGWLLGLAGSALRWGLWLAAIHLGARLLGLGDGLTPLFRALGFAALPFALGLLQLVPVAGGLAWVAKWALGFATFATATRAVLQAELPTAALLCAAGLAVSLLLSGMVL